MRYGQDPFTALLSNKKVDVAYWASKAGVPSRGIQDDAVAALRKMGYSGTLQDMIRAFYRNLTGIKDLTTAWVKANEMADVPTVMNFVGKVKNDGGTSRIMKYGNAASVMLPSAFTTEVNSGYAGASVENDASFATWSSTTPVGTICQLCCFFTLTAQGTVAANIQNFKELKVYANVVNSSVKVFNQRTGSWENRFTATGTQSTTFDLNNGAMSDYLGSDNTIKVGVIANAVANGSTVSSSAQIDFIRLTVKSLK